MPSVRIWRESCDRAEPSRTRRDTFEKHLLGEGIQRISVLKALPSGGPEKSRGGEARRLSRIPPAYGRAVDTGFKGFLRRKCSRRLFRIRDAQGEASAIADVLDGDFP